MPRRRRQTVVNADPVNALQTLIEKHRRTPDLKNLDFSDINRQTYDNEDALSHYVARYGGPDEVSLLVASGANVDLQGDMGYTPLHYAAGWGKLDNVIRLLELGADPHIKNEFGYTPKDTAEMSAVIYPERQDVCIKIAKILKKAS